MNVLTLEIRDASESDAAEILRVQKLAFHGQAVLYNDFSLPPLVQTLEEMLAEFKECRFLKAVSCGAIVGSVRGRSEGQTCHVSRLFVHPDWQSRGVGKMLMRAIEERFGSAKRFELFTGHKSAKNLELYAQLGYVSFGERVQSPNVRLICLEKRKQ